MALLIPFLVLISLLFLSDLSGWRQKLKGSGIFASQSLLWLPYWFVVSIPVLCVVTTPFVPVFVSITLVSNELRPFVRSIYGSSIDLAIHSLIIGIFVWSTCIYFFRRIVKFKGKLCNATFERINAQDMEIHLTLNCNNLAKKTTITLLDGLKEHLNTKRIEELKSAKITELIVASLWLNSPKIISKVLNEIKKLHPTLSTLQITNYKMGWLPSISLRIYQLIEMLKIYTESKIQDSKFRINKYFLNIFLKILKLLKPSKCNISMWRTFDKIDKSTESDFFSRPLMSGFIIVIT